MHPLEQKRHLKRKLDAAVRSVSRSAGWPPLPALSRVIHTLTASGGLTCLAHPLRYVTPYDSLKREIRSLADVGLTALEAFYAPNPEVSKSVVALADSAGLDVSIGSDLHHNGHAVGWLDRLQPLLTQQHYERVATSDFFLALTGEGK